MNETIATPLTAKIRTMEDEIVESLLVESKPAILSGTLETSLSFQQLETQHTPGVYAKRPLTIVRGMGATLYDEFGNAYIDCVGGQGAANLGHGNPRIADAIARQAARLISCPELFYNDQRALLLDKLTHLLPGMERVYLCNSGTEAVEAAIKFARYATKRTGIVAAKRGFHGRTFGALSATWNSKYREPFMPLVPDFSHVAYNNLEALEQAVNDQTAAVLLEVVQGEGGVHPGQADYLRGAQEICRQRGALFIVDEVQTGWGRTGQLFAFMHHELQPDLVAAAKSMAGGIPMGATFIGERVGTLEPGIHGSTFGGNPLACAAALAAMQVIESEKLVENSAEMGAYFMEELHQIQSPLIRDIRGLGLIIGIEIRQKVAPYLSALTQRGLLALSAGLTVIRLLPPLVITRKQVKRAVEILVEVLSGELADDASATAES